MNRFKEFLKRKDIEISAKRYFIDAMGAMAQGLFCSLLIGTIINTLGTQLNISFLTKTVATIGGSEYTVGGLASAMSGPAMAVAIGYALHCPPMVLFSLTAVGFASNALGGAGGAPDRLGFAPLLPQRDGRDVVGRRADVVEADLDRSFDVRVDEEADPAEAGLRLAGEALLVVAVHIERQESALPLARGELIQPPEHPVLALLLVSEVVVEDVDVGVELLIRSGHDLGVDGEAVFVLGDAEGHVEFDADQPVVALAPEVLPRRQRYFENLILGRRSRVDSASIAGEMLSTFFVMKTSDLSGLSGCGFLMSQTPNE